ncbi:HNH endonuclease [Neisseria subflava]
MVLPSDAECDHIVPLADGGEDDVENLQTLCKECHSKKSVSENRRRNRRW